MSDPLTLAHAIADAGIEREKAENIGSAVVRLVEGGGATKADPLAQCAELKTEVPAFRADPKADIAAVKADITELRTASQADLQAQGADLKADISAVRAELRSLKISLAGEIGCIAGRTLIRVSGVLVVLLGLLFAALRAWPPH